MDKEKYTVLGKKIDTIDVKISKRIIQLFSEGLYSSPQKAIEELVSNSFDANAKNVHVILSPDLTSDDATIVVIDDGESMNIGALKEHWIIGRSTRRDRVINIQRKPIGKFGIGKLATYVLAEKLTHICKIDGKYYAATMNYLELFIDNQESVSADQNTVINSSPNNNKLEIISSKNGVYDEKQIQLPIRELTENEAKESVYPWVNDKSDKFKTIQLFGDKAPQTWTVAIMSNLKQMGKHIQRGKLGWLLRTAMPIRDDFHIYLNGDLIIPSKIDNPIIQKWIIGQDIVSDSLRPPCPDGFISTLDESYPQESIHYYGLSHEKLGRITGYIELYEDDITTGKSSLLGRSNGFFIYVHDRLINTADEDDGFGIQRNLLQHGTFSQFRVVIYIDSLDYVLRSSRESIQEGELYKLTQNFLHAIFNLVRNRLVEYEKSTTPGAILSARISATPGSLTRTPLFSLLKLAIEGKINPLYIKLPRKIDAAEKQNLIDKLNSIIVNNEDLIRATEFVTWETKSVIASYDFCNGVLLINDSHPFVAAFHDLYSKPNTSLPLELYAITEILTEADLYFKNFDEKKIRDILRFRDELLRYFVKSSSRRTPGMIALALLDAKDDAVQLEIEMRAAFETIGFDNVIRIGGSGKPDGTAESFLPSTENGELQYYKVGLEAKSGGKVSAKRLGVSGINRHMIEYGCNHHVVIANSFETSTGEDSASVKEIEELRRTTDRTITLMFIEDLAKLVRLVPVKRIGLERLRELLRTCITPEETKAWIEKIENEKHPKLPYQEILETIWQRAQRRRDQPVEYAAVMTALEYRDPPIKLSKLDIISYCKAMQSMAPDIVHARDETVEIRRRPDLVMLDFQKAIDEYPDNERRMISI